MNICFRRCVCFAIVVVCWIAVSVEAAASPEDDLSQTFSRLHSVMSDAIKASNDVYLAQQFDSLSKAELRSRIEGWWRAYMSDPAIRRLWSANEPAGLGDAAPTTGLIDPQSFFQTSRAIRTAHQKLRSQGRTTAEMVRLEKYAADLARDFVRKGIVRSYQLRGSMWYEPVWTLAFQNGYCVDYADWYYWTARLLGVQADILLASSVHARDYADHVVNLVAYSDGKLEVIEPQDQQGFGKIAWVLILSKSGEAWQLARLVPEEFGKADASHVRGLGIYALEALRYEQRAKVAVGCVRRCLFHPTFSDAKKRSSAIDKATDALFQFSSYADLTRAGSVHYQAALLLELAKLYRASGQQALANKYASMGESLCLTFAGESHPVPVRIDALYARTRQLVTRVPWMGSEDPAAAQQMLVAAERDLRTAIDLGSASRCQHLGYNFDLWMATIANLRIKVRGQDGLTPQEKAAALAETEQARRHADKAVAVHRDLRDKVDADLDASHRRRFAGIFNKRAFRGSVDRYLRTSYLVLGEAHQTNALLLLDIVTEQDSATPIEQHRESLEEAESHLQKALEFYLKRSQVDDITGEPDRVSTHSVRMHLACVAIKLGQANEARGHLAAADGDAREIRQRTRDPLKLRQWERERAKLRALVAEEIERAKRGNDEIPNDE